MLVDATGQPLSRQIFRYDAFGNRLDNNTALTTLLYSGELTDATGLQYLRARYYDSNTGRFNRLDPFFGNLEDPLSLHKYLYTHGDPVQGVDPSGEFLGVSISGLLGAFMWVSALGYVGTAVIEAEHALSKCWELGFGGYDATNRLVELRRLLRDKWYGGGGQQMLSFSKKQQISDALHSPTGFIGWDIDEMLRIKDKWTPVSFGPDRIARTLTFRNKVYHVAEVNYIWWGMVNRLLYDSGIDKHFTNRTMTATATAAYRLGGGPVLGLLGMFWDSHEESVGKVAWTRFGWDFAGPQNENMAPPSTGEFPYAIPNWEQWPYWLSGRIGVAGSVFLLQTTGRMPPNA